jgi:hypothetical protein
MRLVAPTLLVPGIILALMILYLPAHSASAQQRQVPVQQQRELHKRRFTNAANRLSSSVPLKAGCDQTFLINEIRS